MHTHNSSVPRPLYWLIAALIVVGVVSVVVSFLLG